MADKKETEMKKSGDIAAIRGLDSAGNSTQSTVDQLTDKMRIVSAEQSGLISPFDKKNIPQWFRNNPQGGDMKGMVIETSIDKSTYASYSLYLWFGQTQNSLANEIFWINLRYWDNFLHAINKLGKTSYIKEIILYFNNDNKLCVAINFSTLINNSSGANEVSLRKYDSENQVTKVAYTTTEYSAREGDYIISIT